MMITRWIYYPPFYPLTSRVSYCLMQSCEMCSVVPHPKSTTVYFWVIFAVYLSFIVFKRAWMFDDWFKQNDDLNSPECTVCLETFSFDSKIVMTINWNFFLFFSSSFFLTPSRICVHAILLLKHWKISLRKIVDSGIIFTIF